MSRARWSLTNSFVFKCGDCDFQKEFSHDYNEKRIKRLHNKVCKKTGRTNEGQSTNKTTNMKKLTEKASKRKGWEMVSESGCHKIEPAEIKADHVRVMKRIVYERLVNESRMTDEMKKELMEKDDNHINAVLDNFGIKVNFQ